MHQEAPIQLPPEQVGDRVTRELSARGARAIAESCAYVATVAEGYSTFLTLTFDQAARARMQDQEPEGRFCPVAWTAKGKPRHDRAVVMLGTDEWTGARTLKGTTVAREASRFFDAAAKVYTRGWVPAYRRGSRRKGRGTSAETWGEWTPIYWNTDGERIEGGADFRYCWVAEAPEKGGRVNPHVHVLMDWAVSWDVFPQWAYRIERLWGQGFAHLERLKAKQAASYYMAKAAGYLSKAAGNEDQGEIRGNRYGISRPARAPGWHEVTSWAWGVMGDLIAEARERMREKTAPIRAEVRAQKEKLAALPKLAKRTRKRTAERLQAARRRLEKVGAYFGRKLAVFRGRDEVERWLEWARRQGWEPERPPEGLWLWRWRWERQIRRGLDRFRALAWDETEWMQALEDFDRWERVDNWNYSGWGAGSGAVMAAAGAI